MLPLTDLSPMPFGKYKGVPMANIEASYLLWLQKEMLKTGQRLTSWQHAVYVYVNDNMEILEKEVTTKTI